MRRSTGILILNSISSYLAALSPRRGIQSTAHSHFTAVVVSVCLTGGAVLAQPHQQTTQPTLLTLAANEILKRQAKDGAITMGVRGDGGTHVEPYFANLAAIGLTRAYTVTHNSADCDAVKRWLTWYAKHMNKSGVVDDYAGAAGRWVSTHTHDSVDSYAATYIDAVYREFLVTNDRKWLAQQYPYVHLAIHAVASVITPTGLTIAKPSYAIMYTMDNVETLRGLQSAHNIAVALRHPGVASYTGKLAMTMWAAIGKYLWLSGEAAYAVAMAPDRTITSGLSSWYPDIMANLLAIAWLPKSHERTQLFHRLYTAHSTSIPLVVNTESGLETVLWWAMAARECGNHAVFAQLVTKLNAASAYLRHVQNTALLGHVCRIAPS